LFEFHQEALREIDDAESYLETEAPHIVQDFRIAVKATLERIRIDPDSYPRLSGNYRSLQVARFPYLIWFRSIDESSIAVVAFSHTSRRPGYWKNREPG
ncbi:MAG: type II toxin-antitoxin system RelE/ParE family toxin, partial [Planctomycetaceae bacterium]|nr:type II toxin-antitoxin system RelE/ParE family toxin [Planctomycetaceae bacterium]